MEGTSEKVNRALFKNKNNVILRIILLFKPYDSFQNEHFCSIKTKVFIANWFQWHQKLQNLLILYMEWNCKKRAVPLLVMLYLFSNYRKLNMSSLFPSISFLKYHFVYLFSAALYKLKFKYANCDVPLYKD